MFVSVRLRHPLIRKINVCTHTIPLYVHVAFNSRLSLAYFQTQFAALKQPWQQAEQRLMKQMRSVMGKLAESAADQKGGRGKTGKLCSACHRRFTRLCVYVWCTAHVMDCPMFCYAAYLSVPTCAWIRSTDLTFNEVFLDSGKLRKEELSLQLILNLDWHTVDRLESEALAFTPLENPTWDSMPDIQKTITQTSTYTCTFLD